MADPRGGWREKVKINENSSSAGAIEKLPGIPGHLYVCGCLAVQVYVPGFETCRQPYISFFQRFLYFPPEFLHPLLSTVRSVFQYSSCSSLSSYPPSVRATGRTPRTPHLARHPSPFPASSMTLLPVCHQWTHYILCPALPI